MDPEGKGETEGEGSAREEDGSSDASKNEEGNEPSDVHRSAVMISFLTRGG